MSGAETARRQVDQRRDGGAEMALPPNKGHPYTPQYDSVVMHGGFPQLSILAYSLFVEDF